MALVLIVEDEVFIRQDAEWMMGDLGHTSLLAANLSEALAASGERGAHRALFVDMRLGEPAVRRL